MLTQPLRTRLQSGFPSSCAQGLAFQLILELRLAVLGSAGVELR